MDGAEVTLFGWVQEVRDLGGIRFIILQDREGTIQVTIPKNVYRPKSFRSPMHCRNDSA